MTLLLRKAHGKPLRDAMKAAGLSGPTLAAATKAVDPTGKGVSAAIIGRVAGQGGTAREKCRLRTAWLIADALGEPIQSLFSMPAVSTDTVERSTPHAEDAH